MKKYFYIAVSILLVFLITLSVIQVKQLKTAKAENERLSSNQISLNSDLVCYKSAYHTGLKTIHGKDSIIQLNAAKVQSLTYTIDEFKQFRAVDVQTIKELNLKLKNVQSVTNIGTQTEQTISTPTIKKDSSNCFAYKDSFLILDGCSKGKYTEIHYLVTDKLTPIVTKIPKHNFLWWSWGIKAIQLDIRAKNPNTKFTYLKYIELKN